MKSVEEIERESKQHAKHWRSQFVRGMVATFIGAFLFVVFSPVGILEYLAYSLFVAPLFIWAYKKPQPVKKRIISSILFYAASAVIYFVLVQSG